MASYVPRAAQVFCAIPEISLFPAGKKEAVVDSLFPSLPGLAVTIPSLSKVLQQNVWSGLVGEVSGSREGANGGEEPHCGIL